MHYIKLVLLAILLAGCASLNRGCSNFSADNFGADWIVVQYRMDGTPFACWRLDNQSVTNEKASDGIYWVSDHGNLVHVGGWYNRVQVEHGAWDLAAKEVGVILEKCKGGLYSE